MALVSVLEFLKDKAEHKRRETEDALKSITAVEERLVKIRKTSQLSFKVELRSLWANEGEKNTIMIVKGSLLKAMKGAIAEFKRINRRNDIQANYKVSAILPGKPLVAIELDELYWGHLKDKK